MSTDMTHGFSRPTSDRRRPAGFVIRILPILTLLVPFLASCSGNSFIRSASDEPISYDPWTKAVRAHVDGDGYVDYAAAEEDDDVWRFIGMVNGAEPSTMNREEELAFWINAYNALTWQLLFDNMPLESITDIAGGLVGVVSPLTSPWEIKVAKIEGKEWSLQEIEDDKVLALGDERVHFAINCASISCPRLVRAAYTAGNMDSLMDANRTAYLSNRKENYLENGTLHLSKIFDWYREDFEAAEGSVIAYVAKYWPDRDEATIIAGMSRKDIEFVDYNWDLNARP